MFEAEAEKDDSALGMKFIQCKQIKHHGIMMVWFDSNLIIFFTQRGIFKPDLDSVIFKSKL